MAAYFAAYDAAEALHFANKGDLMFVKRLEEMGTHLAVWGAVQWKRDFFGSFSPEERAAALAGAGVYVMEFYDPPAATNPNLHAQQGLFTVYQADDDPPLESIYTRVLGLTKVPYMKRVMLPISEAPKLMRLLAEEGVDGASLFPTADGVVRAMKEVRFYDQRP